jgi:hypothetical protein
MAIVSITGSGVAGVSVAGGVTSLTLPAGALRGAASYAVNDQVGFGVAGGVSTQLFHFPNSNQYAIRFPTGSLSNAAGEFQFDGGEGGGVMPLQGIGITCLFGRCLAGPEDEDIPALLKVLPLSVAGAGGSFANAEVTVIGAPWTLAPVSVSGDNVSAYATGFLHGPASQASTAFQPGGVVSLVTPIAIDLVGEVSPAPFLATIGTLHIAFVPEPGTAGLLLSGALLLSLAARRRARSGG